MLSLLAGVVLACLTTVVQAAPPCHTKWQYQNSYSQKPSSPIGKVFNITTPPATDIWRPAFDKDNFTAPFLYTTISTSSFARMRTTFRAPWKTLYDQGGLVITFPQRNDKTPLRWVKAGLEVFEGEPKIGVVATDRLSDWSLRPNAGQRGVTTLEFERETTDLWIYVVEGGQRSAIRQVTWAFQEGVGKEIRVGLYAAKPTFDEGSDAGITVTFNDFSIETKEGPLC